jgi:hypothetical protein
LAVLVRISPGPSAPLNIHFSTPRLIPTCTRRQPKKKREKKKEEEEEEEL